LALGILEFLFGLYDHDRWNGNERLTDVVCFAFPLIVVRPFFTYFSLKVLPLLLPGGKNTTCSRPETNIWRRLQRINVSG
jgi:hypothetical protein